MAGTREGGLKAAATLKAKRGHDFYARIGRKGGKAEVVKGFATNRRLASIAGSKGGRLHRRRVERPKRRPVPRIVKIRVHYI